MKKHVLTTGLACVVALAAAAREAPEWFARGIVAQVPAGETAKRSVLALRGGTIAMVTGGQTNAAAVKIEDAPKTEATKRLLVNQGATVLRTTGGRTIRLSFNEDSANEPVIGNAILQFRMPLNILFANMKELNGVPNGQMIVQLPDNEAVAEQMIAYFQEKNVGVEAWTENVG